MGSAAAYMLPPKIVPTALRARQESGSRRRTSRVSSAMYVIRAPVPRYAGKRLNFHRSIRDESDSGMFGNRSRRGDPDRQRECRGDLDEGGGLQIGAMI